jgi:hypothetical protein
MDQFEGESGFLAGVRRRSESGTFVAENRPNSRREWPESVPPAACSGFQISSFGRFSFDFRRFFSAPLGQADTFLTF